MQIIIGGAEVKEQDDAEPVKEPTDGNKTLPDRFISFISRTVFGVLDGLDDCDKSLVLHGNLTLDSAIEIPKLLFRTRFDDGAINILCLDALIHRLLAMKRHRLISKIVARADVMNTCNRDYFNTKSGSGFSDELFYEYQGKWSFERALMMPAGNKFHHGEVGLAHMFQAENSSFDEWDHTLRLTGFYLDQGGIFGFLVRLESAVIDNVIMNIPRSRQWFFLQRIGRIIREHPHLDKKWKDKMQEISERFYTKNSAFLTHVSKPHAPEVKEKDEPRAAAAESMSINLFEQMEGWDRVEAYAGHLQSARRRGTPVSDMMAMRAKQALASLASPLLERGPVRAR